MSVPVSVAIVVKDGMPRLARCLDSIVCSDDVFVLLDPESSDGTRKLLLERGVRFAEQPWLGFGPQHQRAAELCRHDWVMKLDSDEELSPELNGFIRSFSPTCPEQIFTFRRKNFVAGTWIRGGGWWPDRVRRLFNRSVSRFDNAEVHERVGCEREVEVSCEELLVHHPYETVDDFLAKMQRYSTLMARDLVRRGRPCSPGKALFRGGWAFLRTWLIKGGVRDGYWGLIIAASTAGATFLKYMKAIELRSRSGEK